MSAALLKAAQQWRDYAENDPCVNEFGKALALKAAANCEARARGEPAPCMCTLGCRRIQGEKH